MRFRSPDLDPRVGLSGEWRSVDRELIEAALGGFAGDVLERIAEVDPDRARHLEFAAWTGCSHDLFVFDQHGRPPVRIQIDQQSPCVCIWDLAHEERCWEVHRIEGRFDLNAVMEIWLTVTRLESGEGA